MKIQRLSLAAALATLIATTLAQPRVDKFPDYAIIPKAPTGADRFLQQYPEYDGRGVVVAIFDTGVDPGAAGLQVTSTGEPKIVDMVDASGSGDVDTSKVVQATDGKLAALSGRELTVDPSWKNPSGDYHIGLKRAFELYPAELVDRLSEKRLEKWMELQRPLVTGLERQLNDWDAAHSSPTKEELKERADIEARLDALKSLQEDYDDPGPLLDCVVFNDGEYWQAVIDTDEDGDLADEKVMTNYRLLRQWSTFSTEDLLNYAVNIYDDGNLLSIVTDIGSHGTHVAGIVAANFPDQPELNGLAPGAQLVSVKIGDARVGSSSMGTGEVRGVIAVLQDQCDLINMSFGGPTPDPDNGRNAQIYTDLVEKHGVIWVSSAGNEGPALSTAGAPGATTEAIFGIGAYVTPEMLQVQYSTRDTYPETQYTFSSRGPTTDGALGIKFSAPGGAISPVPNWTLERETQMHGTSMSSPNACGNIALLLSALKAQKQAYSPIRVQRALENTALMPPGSDHFSIGQGLIQIDRAYEWLKQNADRSALDVRVETRVPAESNGRGIYLREPYEVNEARDYRVMITPKFHEDAPNQEKVEFELPIALVPTARWIECADHLMLTNGSRRLDIRIDPTRLAPGAYYEEIRGYDADHAAEGPIFRIPITVIRPEPLTDADTSTWTQRISFGPGEVVRHFLVAPDDATWVDIRVKNVADNRGLNVINMQALQLIPGHAHSDFGFEDYLRLDEGESVVRSLAVSGGRTMELCFAQYVTYFGAGDLDVEVRFHGLRVTPARVALEGGEIATEVTLEAPLEEQTLRPSGALRTRRQTFRPTNAEVRPLSGVRDKLPEEKQIYELVLDYSFTLDDDATITPRAALTEIVDYNESFQSQIGQLFDTNKRLVASFSDEPASADVPKGDYTFRFHVRYDDASKLEDLKGMPLLLDTALDKPIALKCYRDPDDIIRTAGFYGTRTLFQGGRAILYIATPDFPKSVSPGDVLLGSITYAITDGVNPGAGDRPGGYPVCCVVPPKAQEEKKPEAKDEDKDERTAEEKYAESFRDWQVEQLASLRKDKEWRLFDQLAGEVLAANANYLPALVEQLKRVEAEDRDQHLQDIVDSADRILAQVDRTQLAAYFGVEHDADHLDKKLDKQMKEQKDAVIAALHAKAQALLDLAQQAQVGDQANAEAANAGLTAFEAAFAELDQWVDTTDKDYRDLHIAREIQHNRLGEALQIIDGMISDDPTDLDLYPRRLELLEKLGWQNWVAYEKKWDLIRNPQDYPPL